MKNIKFLIVGILFGIVLSKAEVISWYRIYEMFKFQSFHMYGVIGTAVVLGMIIMYFFKKGRIKTYLGDKITVEPKKKALHEIFSVELYLVWDGPWLEHALGQCLFYWVEVRWQYL